MSFLSLKDPAFWDTCPADLKHMQGEPALGTLTYFLMGKKEDNPPTIVVLKMPPGAVLPRHSHESWRFEIIAQGTMDIGEKVLGVGDVMFSEPNYVYGPHVAGPEGCITFEIFSNYAASHRPLLELDGKQVQFDTATVEGNNEMMKLQFDLMRVAKSQLSGSQAKAVAQYLKI